MSSRPVWSTRASSRTGSKATEKLKRNGETLSQKKKKKKERKEKKKEKKRKKKEITNE